jgi:hypothetical protein
VGLHARLEDRVPAIYPTSPTPEGAVDPQTASPPVGNAHGRENITGRSRVESQVVAKAGHNPIGAGNRIDITIGSAGTDPTGTAATRVINGRGMASHRASVTPTAAGTVATVSGAPDAADVNVTPVNHATDDSTADAATLSAVYGDDDRFRIGGALYTYDSNDKFLNAGKVVDMAKFEELIGVGLTAGAGETKTEATVQVVLYDDDGQSIFEVETAASVA